MSETALHAFVFTDIEGSTKLFQQLGDAYHDLLAEHHAIIRSAVAAHGGREVDNAGDGFFLVFADAGSAVAAALDMQRVLAAHEQLAVRAGIHTGAARSVGDDFVGLAIHHAARVSGAAHGRQVLVTDEAKAAVDGVRYIDLGTHRLKDLAEPIRIWQLAHDELPDAFPPIRSLGVGGGNLPRPRTTFIGREDEMERISNELARPGLLTLTGPGGCGKTRLAIEAARANLQSLPGGGWFVELQSITHGDDVLPAVARTLGVPEGEAASVLAHVVARLSTDPTILILDTCEHVIDACAELADQLLEACPELRLVATSRELLGLDGEVTRRIHSLPIEGPAVDLFLDRARRVGRDVADDPPTDKIARICSRLDGIPLAIELAAARTRHLSLDVIEKSLDDRFRVLTGSDRRALQRHQTLDALVSWSWDLLAPDEASLLRAISVFAATFTEDAAGFVGNGDASVIYRLVDRSLVEVVEGGRFHLLETVRLFASSRLVEQDEAEIARDRHLQWFTELAERCATGWHMSTFFASLEEFEGASSDIHSALEWGLRSGRTDAALVLAASVGWMAGWSSTGASFAELLDQVVSIETPDTLAKARAELSAAVLGWSRSYGTGTEYGARAVRSFEDANATDDALFAWALVQRGGVRVQARDFGSMDDFARALDVAIERGDAVLEAHARAMIAWGLVYQGKISESRTEFGRARAAASASGNELIFGWIGFWSGIVSVHAKDWSAAWRCYEDALPVFRRFSYRIPLQWALDHLSHVSMMAGDITAARAFAEEGLTLSRTSGMAAGDNNYPNLLSTAAAFAESQGDNAQAAMYLDEAVRLLRTTSRRHALASVLAELAAQRAIIGERADAVRLADEATEITTGLEPIPTSAGGTEEPPVDRVVRAVARIAQAAGLERRAAVLVGAMRKVDESEAPRALRSTLADELRASLGDDFDPAASEGQRLEDPLGAAAEALAEVRRTV